MNDKSKIIDIFEDSDDVGVIYYPAAIESLKQNQVVVQLAGQDKRFKITVEEYIAD